jgi:hypothetical protein
MKTTFEFASELGISARRVNQLRARAERLNSRKIGTRIGKTFYLTEAEESLILDVRLKGEGGFNSSRPQQQITLPRKQRFSDTQEFNYQSYLFETLGGQPEVVTPAGRVDLLTDTCLIEIKYVGNWKEAIGQLLVLSVYFQSHKPQLALFGDADNLAQKLIEFHCALLGIEVLWLSSHAIDSDDFDDLTELEDL